MRASVSLIIVILYFAILMHYSVSLHYVNKKNQTEKLDKVTPCSGLHSTGRTLEPECGMDTTGGTGVLKPVLKYSLSMS